MRLRIAESAKKGCHLCKVLDEAINLYCGDAETNQYQWHVDDRNRIDITLRPGGSLLLSKFVDDCWNGSDLELFVEKGK